MSSSRPAPRERHLLDDHRDVQNARARPSVGHGAKGGRAMKLDFPGETAQYRAARDRLLEQEIALRRQMEAVAAERRALPPGGSIPQDYTFDAIGADGTRTQVKLSELFGEGKDSLIVYNMMFPRHRNDDRPKAGSGPTANLP